jgi:PAS domain S-box-containing protein
VDNTLVIDHVVAEGDASTVPSVSGRSYRFIWLGLLAGVGIYFLDVFIDVALFHDGTLRDQLLHPSASELCMRLAFIVLTTSFGLYAFTVLRRERAIREQIQAADKRLEVLFNSAAELIFVIDPEGRIQHANQNVYTSTGYSREDLTDRNIKELFTPNSQHICDSCFSSLREGGYKRGDVDVVRKDGSIINMECSATTVPDDQGGFKTSLIIMRDISERLQAARELEESERRFRAIFNSTYQFIGLLNPEGTVLEANQTALDFIGATNADLAGKKFWDTPWWTHSPLMQDRLREGVVEAAQGKLVRFEAEHIGKEGQTAIIDFSLKPVLNDLGETVLIIPEGRDITERKHAEEEARRMQQESAHMMRLSTMGEMASGMAHELNQPLTALVSYCATALQLARNTPSLPEEYLDILERASGQAHRAGDVIRHLREFVSKDKSVKTRVVLDDLIQGVIDFISWELRGSDIQIIFQPGSAASEVLVNKVQIDQVLINLVRNSVEAITQAGISGGQVDIATRTTEQGSIEVMVADNGPGVDPIMADSLFVPYQTSKETGMGMGLSISRSIIEAHDGKLWFDKQRQQGALFYLSIPRGM